MCISQFSLPMIYPYAVMVLFQYQDKEQEKAFQPMFPVLQ